MPSWTATVLMIYHTLLQVITFVDDFVLVEDAFNDEQSILDTHLTVEDPVLLITIEDGP